MKLPVMITIPLILFILPCLFLIIGGPAAIQVLNGFSGR
jgi:tight adherence protein C